MADVAELVRHHARDLLARQVAQQAGGGRHRGMLGIAAGREGVRLVLVDQVDLGHRQVGALGELLDDAEEFGGGLRPDLLRVAHAQHHLVAVPVGEQVHAERRDQRQHEAGMATQQIADDQHEARQHSQEKGSLEVVHGRKDGFQLWRNKAGRRIMTA